MSAHCSSHPVSSSQESTQKALICVLILTSCFFILEVIGGFWTQSIALLSDAGHMLSDIAALSLSLFAFRFSLKKANNEKTYGFYRFEILAAFINASFLMLIAVFLFFEAMERFQNPQPILALPMLAIATAGFLVNLFGYFLLSHHDHGHNLNLQGAILHILGDLLGSLGAIFAGMMIWWTEWTPIDAIVSIFICLLILWSSWHLLWKSMHVLMEGAPEGMNPEHLKQAMCQVEGVQDICDLHIWSLNSTIPMLTAHVVVQDMTQSREILFRLNQLLKKEFQIEHITLQIEDSTFPSCALII